MQVLIIGSGGREHALAWKISQSNFVDGLFVAPGNGGTAQVAQNIHIRENEITKLIEFAEENSIDLVVVGPEVPLSLGIVDRMEEAGIPCFGPSQAAARLESSKAFAKEIMVAAKVPTADYHVYDNIGDALAYVLSTTKPLVIKADGLAAGKGVIIGHDQNTIVNALEQMFDGAFGLAGNRVVIEEYLEGEEVSLLCLCDGETALPFPSAQDHKKIGDNDTGLNTGGMGAYSPAPVLPDNELEDLTDFTVRPILREMKRRGTPFKGILYAGLMMTAEGVRVIEYNVRFGDPECQVLLPRLESDLLELLLLCTKGALKNTKLKISPKSSLGIVLASEGYPEQYPSGMEINNIEEAEEDKKKEIKVFHAGTKKEDGKTLSTGGRVLCITSLATSLKEAQEDAYGAIKKIKMDSSYYRKDIGAKGLKYDQ